MPSRYVQLFMGKFKGGRANGDWFLAAVSSNSNAVHAWNTHTLLKFPAVDDVQRPGFNARRQQGFFGVSFATSLGKKFLPTCL